MAKEEKSEERKQIINAEIEKMLGTMIPGLDSKAREVFNSKFSSFKTFLAELNQKAWINNEAHFICISLHMNALD